MLGLVSFYAGEFEAALAHLERGIALYDPPNHAPPVAGVPGRAGRRRVVHVPRGPGVVALGYPARGAALADEALSRAHALQHPLSLTYACHFGAQLHLCRRDRPAVETLEETGLGLATEHGFGLFLTGVHRGWLLAERGDVEEGLAQMRRGIAASRERGADLRTPAFLALIAQALGKLGRPAEGLRQWRTRLRERRCSGSTTGPRSFIG